MNKGKTIILLISFGLSFFILGYFRNYVFLTLNDQASALYYHSQAPPLTGLLSMFSSYDYNSLVNTKWVLTFLFTILFALLTGIVILTLFHERSQIIVSLVVYAGVFTISLFFIGIGKLFPSFSQHCFHISRGLAHLLQSPIIAILLGLAIKYYKKTT